MKKLTTLVPGKGVSLMTGVWYAQQDKDKVTLVYADGSKETGTFKERIDQCDNFFTIVSTIQSQRTPESVLE